MAGDWIKFELATLDKPEVCQIADLADIDLDAAVGKLLRVWGWFDQQTEAGNAPSVSKRLLDRLVGVTGFCEHMKLVGWMVELDGVISLPHFERHNGKTAKNRLLTAKRVANHKAANAKGNGKANAAGVSDALPKEDVDVEKKQEQEPPQPPKGEASPQPDPQPDPQPAAAPVIAKVPKPDAMEGFAEFWMRYPKKKSKHDAEKAWAKLKPSADLRAVMLAALGLQVRSHDWTKNTGQFIPLPATWLNGKRWQDESAPEPMDNHHGFSGERDYTTGLEANGDGSYRF